MKVAGARSRGGGDGQGGCLVEHADVADVSIVRTPVCCCNPAVFKRKTNSERTEQDERDTSRMRGVRSAPRGTTLAQPLSRVRQTVAGSLRSRTRGGLFDERKFAGKTERSMALPRSAARGARRKHRLARRRLHAALARRAFGRASRLAAALHQGRGAEPDAEFQSARHGDGRLDGTGVGRAETGCPFGGDRGGRAWSSRPPPPAP